MYRMFDTAGSLMGVIGVLLCAIAGGARVAGSFYVLGFEAMTLFIGGLGLMLAACLAKLQLLVFRDGRRF